MTTSTTPAENAATIAWRDLLREPGFWALWLLGVVIYRAPIFLGEVLYFRDTFFLNAGQLGFLADALKWGQGYPLWNPLHQGGMPFLADVNHQPLYPTSFLALVLEPFRAITVAVGLHLIVAASSMYALMRRVGLSQGAAFVAGAVFAFCGPSLAHSNMPGRMFALALLPPILLAWHTAITQLSLAAFAVSGLLAAFQVMAGAPDLDVLTYLSLILWSTLVISSDAGKRSWKLKELWVSWIGLGCVKAGLAAVQWIPLFELTRRSRRTDGMLFEEFGGFSVDPRRLPELWISGFLGRDSLDPELYWGRHIVDGSLPYVVSITFGLTAIALAAASIKTASTSTTAINTVSLRPKAGRMLLMWAGVGVLGALGRFLPGLEWLYAYLPGIQIFRFPSKVIAFGILPLAVAAALGFDALRSSETATRARRAFLGAVGFLGGLSALLAVLFLFESGASALGRFFFEQPSEAVARGLGTTLIRTAVLAAILGGLVLLKSPARWRTTTLAAILALELCWGAIGPLPTAPADVVASPPAALPQLQAAMAKDRETPGRLFRARQPWPDELQAPDRDPLWRHVWTKEVLGRYEGAKFGLPMVFHEDFHSLAPKRSVNLAFLAHDLPWERRLSLLSTASVQLILTHEELDLPGLVLETSIVHPDSGEVKVYRFAGGAERATLVNLWRTASSGNEAVQQMLYEDFDPKRHAVVEPGEAEDGETPSPMPGCSEPGEVNVESYGVNGFVLQVESPCPTLLVLSETYDPGRTLEVDGEAVPTRKVNYAWTGVFLKPGKHRVEGRYEPVSLEIGAAFSALSALFLALLLSRREMLQERLAGLDMVETRGEPDDV